MSNATYSKSEFKGINFDSIHDLSTIVEKLYRTFNKINKDRREHTPTNTTESTQSFDSLVAINE